MSNREIVNTNYFFITWVISNLIKAKYILENININKLRSRFILISRNISRVVFAHSDLLLILYIK